MSKSAEYLWLRELLAQGIAAGDENPESAVAILQVALAEIQRFAPQLAADPQGLGLRANGQVSLARAHLLAGRSDQAAAIMDEAIRSARGQPLPVSSYGPSVEKLWHMRVLDAKPGQPVIITCVVKCNIYINERRTEPGELSDLLVGTYRLWIETPGDSHKKLMRGEIEVGGGKKSISIRFPPPNALGDVLDDDDELSPKVWSPPPTAQPSVMSRAEFEGKMDRGRTTMIVGGVLLALGGGSVGLATQYPVTGVGFALLLLPSGLVTLIVGGASYGMAKSNLETYYGGVWPRVTPTLHASREGGTLGFALRF